MKGKRNPHEKEAARGRAGKKENDDAVRGVPSAESPYDTTYVKFTPAQLKYVAAKLREKTSGPIYDVDLRQESHGYLDGIPVSWYGERDWANLGKSRHEALSDERHRLHAALARRSVSRRSASTSSPRAARSAA